MVVVFLASLVAAAPTLAQPTVLVMHSQPGDYIGAGGNWLHTPADGTFTATRNFDNGVSLRFEAFPTVWWDLDFAAPQNAALTPGTYEMATRFPFQQITEPGLSVSGNGRGCNMLTGRFTVFEIVYGTGDAIVSFAANFEQHCEGQAPALFGSIRFNAAPRAPYTVTVASTGSGSGTITSFPTGVDCGASCATSVADGLVTALIATPAPGSGFQGWSGPADCADGVVADAASVSCTATFNTCTFAVTPTSLTGSAVGGFGQLGVTATSGCAWTPSSSASDWLFVDTAMRSGSQPLGYSYAPRGPYAAARTATINVGTAVFTLTQPGLVPEFFVSSTAAPVVPEGGTVSVFVTATVVDVPWTASSNTAWLSVPAGGLGSGTIAVVVAPNPSTSPRSGTVVVAGVIVTVQQQGNGPPGPPSNFTAAVDGRIGRFTWTPGSPGADRYLLEAGLAPGDTQVVIPMPAVPGDFQLPGVPAGRFFVRLRGVNSYGPGTATEDTELVVGGNGQSLPTAPRFFLAGMATNGELRAEWLPSGVPGEAVTGYVLEAGTSAGRTDVVLPLGLVQSTTIGNVPAGAYVLRVRAVNGAGPGAPALEQLVVSGNGPAPPGRPVGLSSAVTGASVTLSWSPANAGGAADRYRLEVGTYRGATAFTYDTPVAVTSVGFSGVPPGRYYVRIRGVNAQGLGPVTSDIRVDVP